MVGIVQYHCSYLLNRLAQERAGDLVSNDLFARLALNAWFVMDLFFILSGYLIGHILFHNFETRGDGLGATTRFWTRRAFRTFPLYYVVLLVLAAIEGKNPHLREFLYLTNYPFSPDHVMSWSWSLSVEEHFYLASPLAVWGVLKLDERGKQLIALLALWFGGLFLRLVSLFVAVRESGFEKLMSDPLVLTNAIYVPTHCRIDILTAGLVIAFLSLHHREKIESIFASKASRVAGVLVPAAICSLLLFEDVWFDSGLWHMVGLGTATSLGFGLLILRLVHVEDRWSRALGRKTSLILATLGYGIYLVHVPIADRVSRALAPHFEPEAFFLPWVATLALTLTLSALVAYGLHLLVEKPFLALRDRWAPVTSERRNRDPGPNVR